MKTNVTLLQALKAGLFAGLAAALIKAVLYFIFHSAGIITDSVMVQPNTPMTVVPVVMASLVPSIIAALVFFVFARYITNGYRYFRILAIVLLVASFANPFVGIPNVPLGYALALNLMHIPVVLALFYFFNRTLTPAQS